MATNADRTRQTLETAVPQSGGRVIVLSGHFAIGAAGAISTTATAAQGLDPGAKITGVSFVKTATETGRYTGTIYKTAKTRLAVVAGFEGPADAALPTTTGVGVCVRNSSTLTFDIQVFRTDTNADAEPASGSIIHWICTAVV